MSEWQSDGKSPQCNKKVTEATKQKISKSISGNKHPLFSKPRPPSVRLKISKSLTGKHASAEARRKNSEARKGDKNPMYGKAPWNKGKKIGPSPNLGKHYKKHKEDL
jgi:hypothetical protein